MAVKKKSEETRLVYEVAGEQPIHSGYLGPKMDPTAIVILIDDKKLKLVNIEGILYTSANKLGKRKGSAMFVELRDAPPFLVTLLKDLGLSFPEPEDED